MKSKVPVLLLFLFLHVSCINKEKSDKVTTWAGNGSMGAKNGRRTDASFSNLMGLAVDWHGNVYVADSQNNRIRKIDSRGDVVTLAGTGEVGSADGKGNASSFFYPTALTVDKNGNVFVADTHNNLIRKISADGYVTTVAGRGTAVFDNPVGIAIDDFENLYVSDWHNRIRKIERQGKVTDFAGSGERGAKDGDGAIASFYLPSGIAVSHDGSLFVSDSYNNVIRKISSDGKVITLAGTKAKGSADGRIDSASFFHPDGIAIDKFGNLFIADTANHRIRKIGKDNQVTTVAGTGRRGAENGALDVASFWRPMGVAVDSSGNVYVADYQNNMVRKISNEER